MNYNLDFISNKLKVNKDIIENFVEITKQINDLLSFTTEMSEKCGRNIQTIILFFV